MSDDEGCSRSGRKLRDHLWHCHCFEMYCLPSPQSVAVEPNLEGCPVDFLILCNFFPPSSSCVLSDSGPPRSILKSVCQCGVRLASWLSIMAAGVQIWLSAPFSHSFLGIFKELSGTWHHLFLWIKSFLEEYTIHVNTQICSHRRERWDFICAYSTLLLGGLLYSKIYI